MNSMKHTSRLIKTVTDVLTCQTKRTVTSKSFNTRNVTGVAAQSRTRTTLVQEKDAEQRSLAQAAYYDEGLRMLHEHQRTSPSLNDLEDNYGPEMYAKNCENFIGTVKVPTGLVSIKVNGKHANGIYTVPMATTEGALVASYNRGTKVINEAGGANVAFIRQRIIRAPVFEFNTVEEATMFQEFYEQPDTFVLIKSIAEKTTRHGKLHKVQCNVHGTTVHTRMSYSSGDASGQNMVTFASEPVCKWLHANAPVTPTAWYIDCGHSLDKRSGTANFLDGRGAYVTGEVVLPRGLIEKRMHTSVEIIQQLNWHQIDNIFAGSQALNCQAANALAAIFIATGQDPACVAESHLSFTQFKKTTEGDLQMICTIPSLMIGTIGGGTSLPSQKTCLDIIGTHGIGTMPTFAEVIMGVVMGGELSLISAMGAQHFAYAHKKHARGPTASS
ncbi:3-hydroxy-3-methylglutaryl-coenzyme A reductase 3-like [Anneissia japonica]|uniref:3-hydroxy-3-methylglutaryl-coenzyme A reductase 3-like n=1 Tax=Anneissia japonica TaxID=1529436 RepID=UPI001425B136|nr:3-hydroxy-3-methylglutaryl-coenzyme A reductase 3-like [Anneissia japonica]